jgi:hypothetical protein
LLVQDLPATLHLASKNRTAFLAACSEVMGNASRGNVVVIDVMACSELLWADDLCAQKLLAVAEGCSKLRHVIWPASGRTTATAGYYSAIESVLLRRVAAAKISEVEKVLRAGAGAAGGLVTLRASDAGLVDDDIGVVHRLLAECRPRGVSLDISRNAFTPAAALSLRSLVDDDCCGIVSLAVDGAGIPEEALEPCFSAAASRLCRYLEGK